MASELDQSLASLARVAAEEAEQGWSVTRFYIHCCQVLIEADLGWIDKDKLARFVEVAVERRIELFEVVPLDWSPVYALMREAEGALDAPPL